MAKKLLNLVAWTVFVSVTAACTSVADRSESVQIRIANRSSQDYERVAVTFPTGMVDYGRVEKGGVTAYKEVGKAYRYAQVEVTTGGKSLALQPQDYMGEEPLAPGRYTYALELDPSGALQLELIEEEASDPTR